MDPEQELYIREHFNVASRHYWTADRPSGKLLLLGQLHRTPHITGGSVRNGLPKKISGMIEEWAIATLSTSLISDTLRSLEYLGNISITRSGKNIMNEIHVKEFFPEDLEKIEELEKWLEKRQPGAEPGERPTEFVPTVHGEAPSEPLQALEPQSGGSVAGEVADAIWERFLEVLNREPVQVEVDRTDPIVLERLNKATENYNNVRAKLAEAEDLLAREREVVRKLNLRIATLNSNLESVLAAGRRGGREEFERYVEKFMQEKPTVKGN